MLCKKTLDQWRMNEYGGYCGFKNRWKGAYMHNENKLVYKKIEEKEATLWSEWWVFA